jgi:hypothetical protein
LEADVTTIPSHRFYVYTLARPDARVFYVGKGSGPRVLAHEAEARRDCQCRRCRVIRKIWRQGGEVQRTIIFTTDDELTAYAYEAETIALFAAGVLVNKTAGGDGTSNPCDETRARMSAAQMVPEIQARKRAATKALWDDPEARAKRIEAFKAERAKPESRANRSAASKARAATPEGQAHILKMSKAATATPESREKIRAARKAQFADPAFLAQKSAEQKARLQTPEGRAHHQAMIDAARSPEARAKNAASKKGNKASPETRAKMSAIHKERWARLKASDGEVD